MNIGRRARAVQIIRQIVRSQPISADFRNYVADSLGFCHFPGIWHWKSGRRGWVSEWLSVLNLGKGLQATGFLLFHGDYHFLPHSEGVSPSSGRWGFTKGLVQAVAIARRLLVAGGSLHKASTSPAQAVIFPLSWVQTDGPHRLSPTKRTRGSLWVVHFRPMPA